MRHAFLIEAHTNWDQLRTLLSLLDDSRSSIYVHVDAKSKDFDPAFFEGSVKRGTLHFVYRIPVAWGGDSQIKAGIMLLEEALKSNSDYYHLISGFDLPLHSMDYLDSFFEQHAGKEFVQFSEIGETMRQRTRDRIAIYHPLQNAVGRNVGQIERIMFVTQRLLLHIDRLRGSGLVLGKGTNWFSITRALARYVIDEWPKMGRYFMNSFCADEMFLHTMLLNSPYRDNVYHPDADDSCESMMRLIHWSNGDLKTFQTDDYEELVSSPMLFARKFDERKDSNIIEMISSHVNSCNA